MIEFKNKKNDTKPFCIGCRLTIKEKEEFKRLVELLDVETPSEAIRLAIKDDLKRLEEEALKCQK